MKTPGFLARWRSLSADAEQTLRLLAAGGTLKTHRDLDGEKVHMLHPLHGPGIKVSAAVMRQLTSRRLIDSNKKFPAATYLLTQQGQQVVSKLVETASQPLGSRRF